MTNCCSAGGGVIEIAPLATGSRITVTELGEVYHPMFRFMSRLVFGHTRSIDGYLTNLRAGLAREAR